MWKEILKRFDMEFLIERVTKIEVSDEKEFTYTGHPIDLKGNDAKEALLKFWTQALTSAYERGKEDERDQLEPNELTMSAEKYKSLLEATKPINLRVVDLLSIKPTKSKLTASLRRNK